MLAEVQDRFGRLQRRRQELLADLEGSTDDYLNRPPPAGGWSVIQVVAHLILSEARSLSYIERKLQDRPEALPEVGLAGALRSLALTLALRSPFRFKAPEVARNVPDRESFADARLRWDELRESWSRMLESFPETLRHRAILRHPRAGRIDIIHTLTFLDEHLANHVRQVERIRAAVG